MKEMMFFWFIVALVFFVLEIGHPGLLLFLSFSCGALLSALASIYNYSIVVQSLIFLGGTIVSLFIMHRWLIKKNQQVKKGDHTNVYALQGKRGRVTRAIGLGKPGQVKVGGETWSAREVNGVSIEQGAAITVVRISGSHMIVQEDIQ